MKQNKSNLIQLFLGNRFGLAKSAAGLFSLLSEDAAVFDQISAVYLSPLWSCPFGDDGDIACMQAATSFIQKVGIALWPNIRSILFII